MKTFTSIKKYPEGTCGYRANLRIIFLVESDPKREGMYKMSEFQTGEEGEKTTRFIKAYGKSRQSWILEQTKAMIEI